MPALLQAACVFVCVRGRAGDTLVAGMVGALMRQQTPLEALAVGMVSSWLGYPPTHPCALRMPLFDIYHARQLGQCSAAMHGASGCRALFVPCWTAFTLQPGPRVHGLQLCR